MKKSFNNTLSKTIFIVFFVYIMILGLFNVGVALGKPYIEKYLTKVLDAKQVKIGNISNLPLVFVNGTKISVTISDEISLEIDRFYIHYRFWHLLIGQWKESLSELKIDKISFQGHSDGVREYLNHLKKYQNIDIESLEPSPDKKKFNIKNINFNFTISIREILLTVRMMTEFYHSVNLNNFTINLKEQNIKWDGNLELDSVWSNCVFLADGNMQVHGELDNISDPYGNIEFDIDNLNLAGLPVIDEPLHIQLSLSNQKIDLLFDNEITNNLLYEKDKKTFKFNLEREFDIDYNDYEEYELLDYVFKPGKWKFTLNINSKPNWQIDISLNSSQYPDYGLDFHLDPMIAIAPATPMKPLPVLKKQYEIALKLKTHYFGTILGDLNLFGREGLYPLPSGQLTLKNVRFILPGLVFSGRVFVDSVPKKNELELAAFDVKMNDGYIGNTYVKFAFFPNGAFNIYSLFMPTAAVEINASIFTNVLVNIKAIDVDGDFVAKNIKIPIFGLKESRYKGNITICKTNRRSDVLVKADVTGYLDSEPQIQAHLDFKNTLINVSEFRFINQDLLLYGDVLLNTARSNTIINIDAFGRLAQNPEIPIDVDVLIQKTNAWVDGLIDNQVDFHTITTNDETTFTMNFDQYPLKKLGLNGNLSGKLLMGFAMDGWTRFGFQKGVWNIADRNIILDYDSVGMTNFLKTSYMRIGLDKEILDSYGYFKILDDGGISGAFRFDRGGSLQFSTASYTWQLKLDIQDFIINNLFDMPILKKAESLRSDATEKISASLLLNLKGLWSDPDFFAQIKLEGLNIDNSFHFSVSNFQKINHEFTLTNLRLRHDIINIDSDINLKILTNGLDIDMKGAFALGNAIKTEFMVTLSKHTNQAKLKYQIPNLYFLSKKPINISGAIFQQNDQLFFISDHYKYGLAGSYLKKRDENSWNITFKSDSVELNSEGLLFSNTINMITSLDLDLNKMEFTGDIGNIKGLLGINTIFSGARDKPNIDGDITVQNIFLNLKSIRNRLYISNKVEIPITNGQVLFNDIPIYAKGGGTFGLNGAITILDSAKDGTLLNLYSKEGVNNKNASLNWDLKIPYFLIKGKTFISNITLSQESDNYLLAANIEIENLNLGLELEDSVTEAFNTGLTQNPILPLLGILDVDINVDLARRTKFFNQLFNLYFEPNQKIQIQGNIADNTIAIDGDIKVEKGSLSYLGKKLNIESGNILFSGEEGDPYPNVNINTFNTEKTIQNETVEIFVAFEGKLPNIELASISSIPQKSRSELYGLLGLGGAQRGGISSSTAAEEALASGVGLAENALFTEPFSQRIQKIIPFDNLQIKTDVLGNLTRSLSAGTLASGFSILHGSELEVGQYLPNVSGLQWQYKLRLESPDHSGLNLGSSLNHYHQTGFHWTYLVPNFAQVGLGASIAGEVKQQTAQKSEFEPELLLEGSIRSRF